MTKLKKNFKVIHPFHPLYKKELKLANFKKSWGYPHLEYYCDNGDLECIPLDWTDANSPDPFNEISKGKSIFRILELLRLVKLIEDLSE